MRGQRVVVSGSPPCSWSEFRSPLPVQYGKREVHYAAMGGHLRVIKSLVAAGVDLNSTDDVRTPWHGCLCTHVLWHRVDTGETDSQNGKTVLHYAAMGGHLVVVEEALRTAGVDVDKKDGYWRSGKNALLYAAAGGHVAVVKALLDFGAAANVLDNVRTLRCGRARGTHPVITVDVCREGPLRYTSLRRVGTSTLLRRFLPRALVRS